MSNSHPERLAGHFIRAVKRVSPPGPKNQPSREERMIDILKGFSCYHGRAERRFSADPGDAQHPTLPLYRALLAPLGVTLGPEGNIVGEAPEGMTLRKDGKRHSTATDMEYTLTLSVETFMQLAAAWKYDPTVGDKLPLQYAQRWQEIKRGAAQSNNQAQSR